MTQIVLVTNDKMRALRESAEYQMANLVRPIAQQALDTGKTVALVLGQKTLNITQDMAKELLESPWVIGLVLIGWYGSGNIPITQSMGEFWTTKILNYGRSIIGLPVPEVSQWAKYMLMAKDVGATLQVGVKTHFGMKFAKSLAKEIGILSEIKNGVQHKDVKDIVGAQVEAIKALTNALQTQNVVAARRHVNKLPTALQDEMPSDADANYRPVRSRDTKRRALMDKPKFKALMGKRRDYVDEFSATRTEARENPTVHSEPTVARRKRKGKGGAVGISEISEISKIPPAQRALRAKPKLVTGGGGLAPVLEFNETADDPYVMRQQVH